MSLRLLTVLGSNKLGGAEAFFVTLNIALRRHGVDLHAVIRGNPVHAGQLTAAGIPFDTAGFGGLFDFTTAPRLKSIVRSVVPDAVLTFAGRASQHMPRGPYPILGRLGGYYNLKHFRNCDHLVCNTPDLVRHVTQSGWNESRVSLIPNFPQLDDAQAVSRAAFDTPEGVPLAIAMGRLHPNKGLDVLIRALRTLPDLWLWIAGEGEEGTRLRQLAAEMGVASRVKFLGWRTDRAALFRACDLCIFPSRAEPFGNVIVEAWAYGVPVVAAASTGPSWLIGHREDGLLVPVDDPLALASAVRDLSNDSELAAKLAANGRLRVVREFSEEAIVTKYLTLLERLRQARTG